MKRKIVLGAFLFVLLTSTVSAMLVHSCQGALVTGAFSYIGSHVALQTDTSSLYGFDNLAPNGRSFGVSLNIGGSYEGGYPVVALDNTGGVYVTWYNLDTLELFFICSHDGGRTWGPVIRIAGGGNPVVGCSDCDVAVDLNSGDVYVAWIDNRTGHTDVHLCRSVNHGVSFSPAVTVNSVEGSDIVRVDNGASYSTHVAVANDGTVFVAWEDNRTSSSFSDVYLARSTDEGQTFGANVRVNPAEAGTNHTEPWITFDQAGIVYVAYTRITATAEDIYLTKSLDKGSTFGTPVKINDDSGDYYRGKKEVAISKDGEICVVWTDGRNPNGYWDIYFATSTDGGVSFGPNIRVNDDHVANWHGTPSLVIDSAGGINIVWEDFRNNGVTPTYYRDVYYAHSDDGIQFSENVKVNYLPNATWVDCADPNVAIDSNDNLYIVWADSPYSEINYTVYFAYSEGWTSPMFQHDQTHSGYSTSAAPNTNQTLWDFTTSGPIYSSPAIANGMVYVSEGDKIYALEASTGALIWIYTATGNLFGYSSPAIADSQIYDGGELGIVYALNASTAVQTWNYTTGGSIESSPTVAYGTVYAGSYDSKVYALNASTGTLVWTYATAGPVISSPAVSEDVVYVGSNDSSIYALNASTGALIWKYATGGQIVHSSPAIYDGTIFIGSFDGKVYALDASTGALVWSFQTGLQVPSSPAVADGIVYVGSMDYNVYALNASTGAQVWNFTTGSAVFSSPEVADGKVFIGSDDTKVYALNGSTGTLLWSYSTPYFVRSSPAVAYDKLYIGSNDGLLYVFGPAAEVPEFSISLLISVSAALFIIAVVAKKLKQKKILVSL